MEGKDELVEGKEGLNPADVGSASGEVRKSKRGASARFRIDAK